MRGFLPLSGKEIMLDVGIGAAIAPISNWLAPFQTRYLGAFGGYSDEAALAITGSLAHKYGSGLIKDAGKELFRVSLISAGTQLGSNAFKANGTAGNGLYM